MGACGEKSVGNYYLSFASAVGLGVLKASSVAKSIRAQALVESTENYCQSAQEAALINEPKDASAGLNRT